MTCQKYNLLKASQPNKEHMRRAKFTHHETHIAIIWKQVVYMKFLQLFETFLTTPFDNAVQQRRSTTPFNRL